VAEYVTLPQRWQSFCGGGFINVGNSGSFWFIPPLSGELNRCYKEIPRNEAKKVENNYALAGYSPKQRGAMPTSMAQTVAAIRRCGNHR
jgi:hypothetical protein